MFVLGTLGRRLEPGYLCAGLCWTVQGWPSASPVLWLGVGSRVSGLGQVPLHPSCTQGASLHPAAFWVAVRPQIPTQALLARAGVPRSVGASSQELRLGHGHSGAVRVSACRRGPSWVGPGHQPNGKEGKQGWVSSEEGAAAWWRARFQKFPPRTTIHRCLRDVKGSRKNTQAQEVQVQRCGDEAEAGAGAGREPPQGGELGCTGGC